MIRSGCCGLGANPDRIGGPPFLVQLGFDGGCAEVWRSGRVVEVALSLDEVGIQEVGDADADDRGSVCVLLPFERSGLAHALLISRPPLFGDLNLVVPDCCFAARLRIPFLGLGRDGTFNGIMAGS